MRVMPYSILQEEASSAVLDVITTRVGLAPFFEKLEGLFGDAQFQEAAQGPEAPRAAMRTAPTPPRDEEGDDEGVVLRSDFHYACKARHPHFFTPCIRVCSWEGDWKTHFSSAAYYCRYAAMKWAMTSKQPAKHPQSL